jgi:ferric-dicitrate binding protein FerR (iron transport regulator)
MSIVNRRNAMIGWMTWTAVKRAAAMKAKRAAPSGGNDSSKGRKAVKASAIAAALVGAVVFWKVKHRDSTDYDSLAAEGLGGDPDSPGPE